MSGMNCTVEDLVRRVSGIHDRIAEDAGIKACRVRCHKCGREQTVDGGSCLANGWPTCCGGMTMTLVTAND